MAKIDTKKEFLTKATYNKGWSKGYKMGWNSALKLMQEYLTSYKEIEEGFSEYQSAMDDAIELAENLKGKE